MHYDDGVCRHMKTCKYFIVCSNKKGGSWKLYFLDDVFIAHSGYMKNEGARLRVSCWLLSLCELSSVKYEMNVASPNNSSLQKTLLAKSKDKEDQAGMTLEIFLIISSGTFSIWIKTAKKSVSSSVTSLLSCVEDDKVFLEKKEQGGMNMPLCIFHFSYFLHSLCIWGNNMSSNPPKKLWWRK